MTVECKDLEFALRRQEPELMAAARAHAETCAHCREELRLWDEIAAAGPALRREWQSPDLWPRIRELLLIEARLARRPRFLAPAATAAAFVLSAGLAWLFLPGLAPREAMPPRVESERQLLTERAVLDIERSEAQYVQSIHRLATLVAPRVQKPRTPLLANYREKLLLIDAAIAECRLQIDRNRFNAHLRQELLSIYQEKQRTLQQLMREDKDAL